MEALIQVRDMSHIYHQGQENEKTALSHVNFTIGNGEFVAVLGANGSGKSTLAKHLNALLVPTEGQCLIAGMDTRDESELWNIRQQVGMVFQNPDNQIIAALVEDDVAFGPENLGVPPELIRQRVTEALEAVHMEEFRSFAPHLLSGGQKQRVAIAGALAMRTRCLVLDEATAMLDPRGREEIMSIVRRLNREQGITVIHITHFMEEAAAADRILIMEHGRLIHDGTPGELLTDVKEMKRLKLEVPLAAEVADRLRRKGIPLPKDIFTEEELAAALKKAGEGKSHGH